MKKVFSAVLLAGCLTMFPSGLPAQVRIASVFTDGMILQQSAEAPVWGKATPGTEIAVTGSWDGRTCKTTAGKDSIWKVSVRTPAASLEKYTLKISSGKKSRTFSDVLIGEVWLCGGQSNMEMPMKGFGSQPVFGSTEDIALSSNDLLRCFTVRKKIADTPQDFCSGSWETAGPNTTPDFTATGYYFARMLQKVLGIPVGIIHSSYGGSTIEAWIPREKLEGRTDMKVYDMVPEGERKPHTLPVFLFNGMLNPIAGYAVRGAVWYQGEANVGRPEQYVELFRIMQDTWAEYWGMDRMPIYLCQIAPFRDADKAGNAFLREAQLRISETVPDTGLAVLMDCGEKDCIHPGNKKAAGERIAYIALAKNYGFPDLPYTAPVYKKTEFRDGKAIVSFHRLGMGFTTYGKPLTGFEVAGADRIFHPAEARLVRNIIEVSSDKVDEPIAVRYAFKGFITGSLFGANGLPVSSFRSDDWNDVY